MTTREGIEETEVTDRTEAVGDPRKLNVALLEDEEDLRELLLTLLQGFFGDRLGRVFESDTYKAFEEALERGEIDPDVIITDLNLIGTPVPVFRVAESLGQRKSNTGLLLMTGESQAGDTCLARKRSVHFERLDKPFGNATFGLVLEDMRLHIDKGYTEGEITQDDLVAQTDEPIFDERLDDFPNLSELVRSLPRDPAKLVSYPQRFNHLTQHLLFALEGLIHATLGTYDDFLEAWSSFFPLQKRFSLAGMLSEHPGADFVLDFCIHDIQNKLAYLMLLQNGEREKAWEVRREEVRQILTPAFDAFNGYGATGNEHLFWSDQNVAGSLTRYSAHYSGMAIDPSSSSFEVDAPAGALHSIWETFVSNAQKVSHRKHSRLELGTQVQGDVLTARVYDDLKPFDPTQLRRLFDDVLSSERGKWGMGTGLLRLGQLMTLMWGGHTAPEGQTPIESYHLQAHGQLWIRKAPGQSAKMVTSSRKSENPDFEGVPEWATKFFVLRFPRVD